MKNTIITVLFFISTLWSLAQGKNKVVNSAHPSLNYVTIECSELNQKLKENKNPIIIFCGDVGNEKDKYTYSFQKIKGALAIGSVNQASWKSNLQKVLAQSKVNQSFSKEVIVYCGCCSSDNCPNVEPVILELKRLGFKNVKGLYFSEGYLPEWHGKKYLEQPIN